MQNKEELNKHKKIFFIGIGGIGVSALAKLLKSQGKKVSGSDKYSSEITDELRKRGIRVYIGHREKNIDSDTDLVIYSAAVGPEIPEMKKAAELKIKQLSYPEALGLITENKDTIAVSGTHGKSTTTAILGLILIEAKLDPTIIVGSKVGPFKYDNLQIGKSDYFVVEACEWRAHMLNLKPKIVILTNLEKDHLDYYKNFKNIKKTFDEYVSRLPKDGLLVLNADDRNCLEIGKSAKCKKITYGIKNKTASCRADNAVVKNQIQQFNLFWHKKDLGRFFLKIPGQFNIYNALAAVSCALSLRVIPETIKEVLADFKGIWRRFEKIGEYSPRQWRGRRALIFSDYAHHPTAVKETLKAAREFYPNRRLVVVFQPHHFDRTKRLFSSFTKAFDLGDLIILNEIYGVPGRELKKDISSRDLVRELKKRGLNALYTGNLIETKKLLLNKIRKNDLVLIIGAGDIYKLKI